MKKLLKITRNCLLLTLCTAAFGWALVTGLDKEAHRMDVVKAYNCQHFGAKMNEMYGKETCI